MVAGLALLSWTGCAVPQPRGEGILKREYDPRSQRSYWLYLPKEYAAAERAGNTAELASRRWPLVVSFHGMKPFDTSTAQAEEWQQEADRYGFVVIAPDLRAPDVLAQFPLRTVHPAFKSDETASMSIIEQVLNTTEADPDNILATSWSSGGYMAHYMMNQHPEVFSCLAVRQSNFSPTVLNEALARESRDHPILILNTQNDFDICKRESREAVQWYERLGYRAVAWVYIKDLGHERTPDLAADFFANIAGVEPNKRPDVLVHRYAIDGNAEGLAFLSGRMPQRDRGRGGLDGRDESPRTRVADRGTRRTTSPRSYQIDATSPISIRISSAIGMEPLHLGFSAVCPAEWYDTASFEWTLNGMVIAEGINGQKTLVTPGEHKLGLTVRTADRREFTAERTIRVLAQVRSATYGPRPSAATSSQP